MFHSTTVDRCFSYDIFVYFYCFYLTTDSVFLFYVLIVTNVSD